MVRFSQNFIGLVATVFLSLASSPTHATGGMTVLTVAGDAVIPNRPEYLAESYGLFAYHELFFEFGYAFDRQDLMDLGMDEIAVEWSDGPHKLAGPRLTKVLAAAGVHVQGVLSVHGLDGYSVEVTPEEIANYNPILALERDKKPLGLGEFGPVYLIFEPTDDVEKYEELSAKQVYGTFFMAVK